MAILGQFQLLDYSREGGNWRVHFVNHNPGPGNPTDFYIDIPDQELPANINQINLGNTLKNYLAWTINQTFNPLNTFIANGTTITLP